MTWDSSPTYLTGEEGIPKHGVIVNRIRRVLPFLHVLVTEVSEIGCKYVSIQEQDVCSDRRSS